MNRVLFPALALLAGLVLWQAAVWLSGVPVYLVPGPGDVSRALTADAPVLLPALVSTLRTTGLALGLALFGAGLLAVLLALTAVVSFAGCSKSSRGSAKAEFVQQMIEEGGIDPAIAECIADRFFELRTDADLKEFFEREELTVAEAEEFGRLAEACAPTTTDSGATG